jgi:hypothetical protein
MVLKLKYFDKIVQKTNSVESGFVKRAKRLEQNMLSSIALGKVLRYGLLGR